MAQGNEQLCLLVFHCFGILCVVYSCMSIYNLANDYIALESSQQSECKPYAFWKAGFLAHVVLFFVSMSFAVGTCDTFLNEEDHEIQEANDEEERQPTTQLIEKSLTVLKVHCMAFCGPFVLVECILSCAYYSQILHGCQSYIEDPMTATLIYVIIVMGCISVAACAYCSYMGVLCVKAGKRALPSMRDINEWQAERQRMIDENRTRRVTVREQRAMQNQMQEEEDMLRWQERRNSVRDQVERRRNGQRNSSSEGSDNYSDYSYYDDEENGESSSYYDDESNDSNDSGEIAHGGERRGVQVGPEGYNAPSPVNADPDADLEEQLARDSITAIN